MSYDPAKHHRRSIRLQKYDYASEGAYFVTICTHNRECILGEIVEGEVRLSEIGTIAHQCWLEIPNHFKNVALDEYVIMPNHVYGIIIIQPSMVGVQYIEPLREPQSNRFQHITRRSIGSMIRSYKAAVTRQCDHASVGQFRWQRNYYEHVIRGEKDLNKTREYIIMNPLQWFLDKENPSLLFPPFSVILPKKL